ncbi:MAG: tRNA preQ1(34) S-adenosylmethionine ribosyltransferase-isomerase QueA [Candidatus Peribacteraceae bacterium]|jgi:S-adenosylmethionine:tRNA ribosyltransferase-isomerase
MTSFEELLGLYDYDYPRDLIAQAPASPRDSARLLVFDRSSKHMEDAIFHDIEKFLPKDALLVLNETKVIPAKLTLQTEGGRDVSVLLLGPAGEGLRAFADRKLRVSERLRIPGGPDFSVEGQDGKAWLLLPSFPLSELPAMLDRFGEAPLPPYIKESPLSRMELLQEYQSVVAREPGSIAAPTASLHFTERLLRKLEKSGIKTALVTLHVHLGTFAPLTEEQWKTGALHREEYHIHPHTAQAINAAKEKGTPVIAVGTTVVRTLESAADATNRIVKQSGTTSLFIREGHQFRIIDGMITNFHVPRSSLLMLVAAFLGRGTLLELYRHAIAERYRLFSFGDAMLIT